MYVCMRMKAKTKVFLNEEMRSSKKRSKALHHVDVYIHCWCIENHHLVLCENFILRQQTRYGINFNVIKLSTQWEVSEQKGRNGEVQTQNNEKLNFRLECVSLSVSFTPCL